MDMIDRQAAVRWVKTECNPYGKPTIDFESGKKFIEHLKQMPSAQPDVADTNVGDINKFIDGLEEIFADLRERHVDDSVCGLCEYDGAYIGESGDWCNECPGFDRDDCFKLSDKCRKRWIDTITNSLQSAQPEIIRCKECKHQERYFHTDRRRKDGGYYIYGCELAEGYSHVCLDDDFCSRAERRTDE